EASARVFRENAPHFVLSLCPGASRGERERLLSVLFDKILLSLFFSSCLGASVGERGFSLPSVCLRKLRKRLGLKPWFLLCVTRFIHPSKTTTRNPTLSGR
ncbi:unnamed protein product, partial [Ectocarpus sp. 12 AP-2014]